MTRPQKERQAAFLPSATGSSLALPAFCPSLSSLGTCLPFFLWFTFSLESTLLLTSPSRMVCLCAAASLELVEFSSYFGMDFQCHCMVSPQGNLHQGTWPGPKAPQTPIIQAG